MPADRPPAALKGRRRRRLGQGAAEPKPAAPIPQKYRAEGAIAKGVNQLYRKAGKLVRVMDPGIGQALIDITRAEDPEDVTVGDAWETLARSQPAGAGVLAADAGRGRVVGGVRGPCPGADGPADEGLIRKRIPFGGLVMAMADDGEDSPAPGEGTVMDGLRPEDMAAMMATAQSARSGDDEENGAPPRGDGQ